MAAHCQHRDFAHAGLAADRRIHFADYCSVRHNLLHDRGTYSQLRENFLFPGTCARVIELGSGREGEFRGFLACQKVIKDVRDKQQVFRDL